MKEFRVWLKYTNNSFQQVLSNRVLVLIFIFGKFIRVALFSAFLFFLFSGVKGIGEYSKNQIIFFYLSFNLIDTLGQLLYREVYRFRELVVSGNLDFVLLKPINPLIRVLLGGADVLDLIMLFLITGVTIWFGLTYITINPLSWLFYFLMIVNGLILATAFHIFVLSVGVITIAIDHMIMVYRDLTSLLRIPVDLYAEPVRAILTFIIPLGIMITFPAKVLMDLLSPSLILVSVVFAVVAIILSLKFWNYSLKQYSSASS